VWTHDSVALGEDGPTHQPIEQLSTLRLIPNFTVVRPADANETSAAWLEIVRRTSGGPVGIALTRQNIPVFPRGEAGFATTDGVAKGAYVLIDAEGGQPDVIIIATGSEVQLAVAARETLAAEGIQARVVSAPSLEWFAEQDAAYRERAAGRRHGARVRRGRVDPALARHRGRHRPYGRHRPLRRLRRLQDPVREVRYHHRCGRGSGPRNRQGERMSTPTPGSTPTQQLVDAGVSIWLDDLSARASRRATSPT
jgi:hypothetical protein